MVDGWDELWPSRVSRHANTKEPRRGGAVPSRRGAGSAPAAANKARGHLCTGTVWGRGGGYGLVKHTHLDHFTSGALAMASSRGRWPVLAALLLPSCFAYVSRHTLLQKLQSALIFHLVGL